MTTLSGDAAQDAFSKLKKCCVPLLGQSLLTSSSSSEVANLLSELVKTLRNVQASGTRLSPSLTSYVFFPLSTILRRNASSSIPDIVMEKILSVLAVLCDSWWWDCDLSVWEQIFMLCSAVIGGIEGRGKGRDRDDETKDAAVQCLASLLRPRTSDEHLVGHTAQYADSRLRLLQSHVESSQFLPILGRTLDVLLSTAASPHRPIQSHSLDTLLVLVDLYLPEEFVPSVLPGIISAMTRISLGLTDKKGRANGDTVAGALKVMKVTIIRSLSDDICVKYGAVRRFNDLEDFLETVDTQAVDSDSLDRTNSKYSTVRSQTWLRGSASQLHIALNSLTPLLTHQTPSALLALSEFSIAILNSTSLTLPASQPLLLSFLLSLSISDFLSVHTSARDGLLKLLTAPGTLQPTLVGILARTTRDNLVLLARLLPSYSDSKVEHAAHLVEAACRLGYPEESTGIDRDSVNSIGKAVGKLLGPGGGIEKWGWQILSVLEFAEPLDIFAPSSAQLMLEDDPEAIQAVTFPEITFKHVESRTTYTALAGMFRSLGRAGGEDCLYSVEWFANIGQNGSNVAANAALWCACRLMEGVGDVSLDSLSYVSTPKRSRRLEKLARGLTQNISAIWDIGYEGPIGDAHAPEDHTYVNVEHRKGLVSIRFTLDVTEPSAKTRSRLLPALHQALCLHMLSLCASILQSRFTSLLLHGLYPVLRSIVSPVPHLAHTALASLHFIAAHMSYASPANLLLANFDYALDAVCRHLNRRWLDIEATKVLVILIRFVGSDVIQRAGDVVEECFDRLDEYHGYDVIVTGLVEVLGEVVKVVEVDEKSNEPIEKEKANIPPNQKDFIDGLLGWFANRKMTDAEGDADDYGSVPQQDWGNPNGQKSAADHDAEQNMESGQQSGLSTDNQSTPTQALTKQIVSRSLYFLTHGSPAIRARILTLLASSVSVLPESSLLPSIHLAWPFILNRLSDTDPTVVLSAASLIESLSVHVGSFMHRKIWDDVWPKLRMLLGKLDTADTHSALARRGSGAVGTESAYTHSHRLYRSFLLSMTAVMKGVDLDETAVWQVIVTFRRFLHKEAHAELQAHAVELYNAIGRNNYDAVWVALTSTAGRINQVEMRFMLESKWDIQANLIPILGYGP